MRDILIEFFEEIREYVRESGTNISHDERESSEFVDIFLTTKNYNSNSSLIAKYMQYVKDIEGIDFIEDGKHCFSDVQFTDQEWEELELISQNNES